MRSFWFEKSLGNNWFAYFGRIYHFRLGLSIGFENELYLGFFMLGVSKF